MAAETRTPLLLSPYRGTRMYDLLPESQRYADRPTALFKVRICAGGAGGDCAGPEPHAAARRQDGDADAQRTALREERQKLVIWRRPVRTIYLFGLEAWDGVRKLVNYVLTHAVTRNLLVPALLLLAVAANVEGAHKKHVESIFFLAEYVTWWVGLGVLSSIGLGTGMHSGVLFLFPHIIETTLAAYGCGSLDFQSAGNIWFRPTEALFQCETVEPATPVSFAGLFLKVSPQCALAQHRVSPNRIACTGRTGRHALGRRHCHWRDPALRALACRRACRCARRLRPGR